jgi:hypothetical protein
MCFQFTPCRMKKVRACVQGVDHLIEEATYQMFLFFSCTGAWTQGLHIEALYLPYFCEGIFKTGSHEQFARAGF